MENEEGYNDELHSLYCLHNIVRMIKSIILKWADHVGRLKGSKVAFNILTGKSKVNH